MCPYFYLFEGILWGTNFFLILGKLNLIAFTFLPLVTSLKNYDLIQDQSNISTFPFEIFKVLILIFKSVVYIVLIHVCIKVCVTISFFVLWKHFFLMAFHGARDAFINGIIFSLKIEWSSSKRYNTGKLWNHRTKMKTRDTKVTCYLMFKNIIYSEQLYP